MISYHVVDGIKIFAKNVLMGLIKEQCFVANEWIDIVMKLQVLLNYSLKMLRCESWEMFVGWEYANHKRILMIATFTKTIVDPIRIISVLNVKDMFLNWICNKQQSKKYE